MTRLALTVLLAGAALFVAACGGGSSSSGGGGSMAGGAANGATVSVASVDPLGEVLVDSAGMTLYTPNVEADGKILCTGACESFWKPLEPGTKPPTANGDAGKLGVVMRPNGTMQVTDNGRPLYTFVEDGPGQAKGDGFTDAFGGRHFLWHAVAAGGAPASSGGGGSSRGSGY